MEEIQFDQYRNTRHFAASGAYQFSCRFYCAACGEHIVDDTNAWIGFASEGIGMDAQGIAAVLEIKGMLDGVCRQPWDRLSLTLFALNVCSSQDMSLLELCYSSFKRQGFKL